MHEKMAEVNWSQLFGFFEKKEQELKSKGIICAMGGGCSSDGFCTQCSDCGECGAACGD